MHRAVSRRLADGTLAELQLHENDGSTAKNALGGQDLCMTSRSMPTGPEHAVCLAREKTLYSAASESAGSD